MFENDKVPIGCDTCDHVQYDNIGGYPMCDAGLDCQNSTADGDCPKYRMTFNYFCQNHAQYDRNTGMMKKVNGNIFRYY
jgi:hypothetical protein